MHDTQIFHEVLWQFLAFLRVFYCDWQKIVFIYAECFSADLIWLLTGSNQILNQC